MTQGKNHQPKAKSASFENNILDDLTSSRYNQRFMRDARWPSAHTLNNAILRKVSANVVLHTYKCACQVLGQCTEMQGKLKELW
jgi:hypothetical protein